MCSSKSKVDAVFTIGNEVSSTKNSITGVPINLHFNNPKKLMHRIRRLFNRAQLYESEWKILRGFISKIQEKVKKK